MNGKEETTNKKEDTDVGGELENRGKSLASELERFKRNAFANDKGSGFNSLTTDKGSGCNGHVLKGDVRNTYEVIKIFKIF